jgi:teichuronic acid exporter
MLKRQAFFATLWSAADVFLRQGLQLFVTIALARLLSPEEFGTIALLSLFIGISAVVVDSGFSSALIQKQDTTLDEESTVFWFNLVASILATLLLCLCASYIARFYSQPALTNIIYVVSLIIVFNASGAVHTALLTKRLDFQTQLKIGVITNTVSGAAAVVFAWKGFGIWALVAQMLTTSLLSNTLLWVFSPWRPRFDFKLSSARSLFGFGGYMVAASLLDTLYSKGYSLLIGKFYSTRELGLYSQAENTKQFPASIFSAILLRVAFPMLSVISADKVKLQRAVQLCIRSMMLLNIPMMLGLAMVANTFVRAIFGAQWLPAVPVLQILCLGGVLWPMHAININVLLAQGHSRLVFNLQIIKSVLGIALLVAGSKFGVIGIAWSQVVLSCTGFLLNTHYTKSYLDYGATRQLRDNLPALLACLPMLFVVYALGIYWHAAPIIKLVGLSAAGTLLFAATSYIVGLAAVEDLFSLFEKAPAPSVEAHAQITEL